MRGRCNPSSWRLRQKPYKAKVSGQHCEPSSETEEGELYGQASDKEATRPMKFSKPPLATGWTNGYAGLEQKPRLARGYSCELESSPHPDHTSSLLSSLFSLRHLNCTCGLHTSATAHGAAWTAG